MLVSVLSKLTDGGNDWVEKLRLALLALTMAPAMDTGLSPYQIVYGRQMKTPLDILHGGWRKKAYEYMDMTS